MSWNESNVTTSLLLQQLVLTFDLDELLSVTPKYLNYLVFTFLAYYHLIVLRVGGYAFHFSKSIVMLSSAKFESSPQWMSISGDINLLMFQVNFISYIILIWKTICIKHALQDMLTDHSWGESCKLLWKKKELSLK